MQARIETLHPQGKNGVRIDRAKYDAVRLAILETLATEACHFSRLAERVADQLGPAFDGSPGWYTVVVKLDLEARGLIRRVPGTRPEILELQTQQADTQS